jgi:hypothetical protein
VGCMWFEIPLLRKMLSQVAVERIQQALGEGQIVVGETEVAEVQR